MGEISIRKKKVSDVGSCNFCRRGILREDESGMVYPYKYVYEISGVQLLIVRLCGKCLKEIKKTGH